MPNIPAEIQSLFNATKRFWIVLPHFFGEFHLNHTFAHLSAVARNKE
jgi:hypothetical protein